MSSKWGVLCAPLYFLTTKPYNIVTGAGSSAERVFALLAKGRRLKSFPAHQIKMIKRDQINQFLGLPTEDKRFKRDLQILITRGKKFGLIQIPSQKEITIPETSVEYLKKIARFLQWIAQNETENLRTSEETERLIDSLLENLINKKDFVVLAFLCPSYKKGQGALGFNREIGETTKRGLTNAFKTYQKLREIGFSVKMNVIFSDLVLENYDEIVANNLMPEMVSNINSAKKFTIQLDPSIKFSTLSNYKKAAKKIPPKGIVGEPDQIDKNTFELILKRNTNFYSNQFGWKDEKIISRTKILACTYPVIGDFFREEFPYFLFVYTANSFERSKMYQGLKSKTDPIPIFFPKKGEYVN